VSQNIGFISDDEVESYFVAADVVVIPYVDIFQSGVPFLAFSFGLPVIATDVGSLREDVTRETGILCRPKDPTDLAHAIVRFYQSGLFGDDAVRARIRSVAAEKHSWDIVSERTKAVYASLSGERDDRPFVCSTTEHEQHTSSRCREIGQPPRTTRRCGSRERTQNPTRA
jgi:glycosyltransferase involved in cell wall biosynthesis